MFQEVGTIKSLHWRCKMWFDCVEQKRRAKLPASATAPRAFRCCAVVPGVHACVHRYILYVCICVYVYVYMCADMYICIYMHVCMNLYIYAFIHMCMGNDDYCFYYHS